MGLGSLWMILGTTVLSLCMVLYQRVMSDRLGNAFADLAALGAMTNVIGVLTTGASITLVKIFAEDEAEGGPGAARGRFHMLLRPLFKVMLAVALALAALAPLAISYLKLNGALPYALFALGFVLSLGTLASRALVQGTQRFGFLSMSFAAEGLGRVALGSLFVGLGAGVAGALGGSALALFVGFSLCLAAMKRLGPPSTPAPRHVGGSIREMAADAAVLGLFSLLCYVDVFVVKHHLSEADAAGYSRAALVAKSFLYLTAALNMVLLPSVSSARAKGGVEAAKKALLKFLSAALLIELAGLAFVWAFTQFVIQVLCGGGTSFQALAPLIRILSAAVVPLSLSQLVLYYLLATRDYRVLWLLAALVAIYAGLLRATGGEPSGVVNSLGLISLLLLAGTLGLALLGERRAASRA